MKMGGKGNGKTTFDGVEQSEGGNNLKIEEKKREEELNNPVLGEVFHSLLDRK